MEEEEPISAPPVKDKALLLRAGQNVRFNKNKVDILRKAGDIAINDLRSNYGDKGIYAGPNRHREYWARDSFITSFGSCAIEDFLIVEKNLDLFCNFQRDDGHIPARIEERFHNFRALGFNIKRKTPKSLHKQTQPWATDVLDSNSWFIIAAENFINTAHNNLWLKRRSKNLKEAASWLVERMNDNGLVYEDFIANWSDCSLRRGYLIYNNILTWRALLSAGKLLGKDGVPFLKFSQKLKKAILTNFWDDKLGYFIDRIDKNGRKYDYFYSDGNLLSIYFGLVRKNKSNRILQFIDKNGLSKVPVPTGYPKLDFWNDLFNRLVFPMYKTVNTFTWLGCILALARLRTGERKKALRDLEKVADKIAEYGTCHEVLTPEGKPVNLVFYKSENKIAWTAGSYLYALNEFGI